MSDQRTALALAVEETLAAYLRGDGTMKSVLEARNALTLFDSPPPPPKAPKRPVLTPTEIRAELQKPVPLPPRIAPHLALAAYRAARERARRKRESVWVVDPMFQTWMP